MYNVLPEARRKNAPPQVDDLIKTTTDALALLGHANLDLSLRRREYLRPCLNQEYSTFCSTQYPVTSLLFGDDLPSRLANIKTTNRIAQSVDGSQSRHSKGQYDKRTTKFQALYSSGKHFLWKGRRPNPHNHRQPQYRRKDREKRQQK